MVNDRQSLDLTTFARPSGGESGALRPATFWPMADGIPLVRGSQTIVPVAQSGGLRFDSTVTLGNLLTIAAFVLSLVAAYVNLRQEMSGMKMKVDLLWEDSKVVKSEMLVIHTKVDLLWQVREQTRVKEGG